MRIRGVWNILMLGVAGIAGVQESAGQEGSAGAPPAVQAERCTAPETRQFDFWVGEWDLKSDQGTAINSIRPVLGGCVIYENFNEVVGQGDLLSGWSVSTYAPARRRWLQTWVDNSGSYLDFEGEFKDGKMILSREAEAQGKKFLQRMVWHNIGRDSLDWNWERSDDGGKSWQALWKIYYTRKKAGA